MSANPIHTKAWQTLESLAQTPLDMRRAFAEDPARAQRYFFTHKGISIDFSKERIDDTVLARLVDLAKAQKITEWRDRMFAGDIINTTEKRAVLHTALRRPPTDSVTAGQENVMPFVHNVLARMEIFSNAVRKGQWKGYTGKSIRTIVNIGIGGSDLGPHMVCTALKPYAKKNMACHFVSNVDGTHLSQVLQQCKPETTLFLIASKTFTTQETMMNAFSARDWFLQSGAKEGDIARHFVALSTNEQAVKNFGIAADNIFPFKDWVGGRYSLWSAIGLSIALAVGFKHFRKLLDGAYAMDRHFQKAPLHKNLPVLMALTGIWNRNFLHYAARAVLPYDQNLRLFPAFLQQLDMESNGKHIDRDGNPITEYQTGAVLFGEPGTNGQHSFYQLIHQGTDIIPCNFIGVKQSSYPLGNHHRILLTHMLAQGQALMQGRTRQEAGGNIHRLFNGNRPSTTILLDKLDPYHLGMLIALYEQKVFVQGIIWNINSFDQYGVELGKELAKTIEEGKADPDSSTAHLKQQLGL